MPHLVSGVVIVLLNWWHEFAREPPFQQCDARHFRSAGLMDHTPEGAVKTALYHVHTWLLYAWGCVAVVLLLLIFSVNRQFGWQTFSVRPPIPPPARPLPTHSDSGGRPSQSVRASPTTCTHCPPTPPARAPLRAPSPLLSPATTPHPFHHSCAQVVGRLQVSLPSYRLLQWQRAATEWSVFFNFIGFAAAALDTSFLRSQGRCRDATAPRLTSPHLKTSQGSHAPSAAQQSRAHGGRLPQQRHS